MAKSRKIRVNSVLRCDYCRSLIQKLPLTTELFICSPAGFSPDSGGESKCAAGRKSAYLPRKSVPKRGLREGARAAGQASRCRRGRRGEREPKSAEKPHLSPQGPWCTTQTPPHAPNPAKELSAAARNPSQAGKRCTQQLTRPAFQPRAGDQLSPQSPRKRGGAELSLTALARRVGFQWPGRREAETSAERHGGPLRAQAHSATSR